MSTFEDKPAVRASVPVLFGIMGPSGGGKTYSALRLATGIQRISGGDIGVIDSEAGRALHYADYFKFRHMDFAAPFSSMRYLEAIQHYVKKGVKTVIVDSASHEHAGAGGYLEYADAELQRLGPSMKLASFVKPSQARRAMIDGILQLKANIIFCFRAKEKVKPVKRHGKTVIEPQGFMPIASGELVYEMTACCLLLPHANGVPTWITNEIGEKMMIKSAKQFESIFAKEQPLSEDIGQQLAEWARGPAAPPAPAQEPRNYEVEGENAAKQGIEALKAFWSAIPISEQKRLKPLLDSAWKHLASNIGNGQPAGNKSGQSDEPF
jgi:ABC-type dipeptide/oligopeptide/nickel transport system ATPase subunit